MTKIFSFRANSEEQQEIESAIEQAGVSTFKEFSFKAIHLQKIVETKDRQILELNKKIQQQNIELTGRLNDKDEEIEELKAVMNVPKNLLAMEIEFETEEQKANFLQLMDRNNLDTPLALFKALYNHVKQSLFKDIKV